MGQNVLLAERLRAAGYRTAGSCFAFSLQPRARLDRRLRQVRHDRRRRFARLGHRLASFVATSRRSGHSLSARPRARRGPVFHLDPLPRPPQAIPRAPGLFDLRKRRTRALRRRDRVHRSSHRTRARRSRRLTGRGIERPSSSPAITARLSASTASISTVARSGTRWCAFLSSFTCPAEKRAPSRAARATSISRPPCSISPARGGRGGAGAKPDGRAFRGRSFAAPGARRSAPQSLLSAAARLHRRCAQAASLHRHGTPTVSSISIKIRARKPSYPSRSRSSCARCCARTRSSAPRSSTSFPLRRASRARPARPRDRWARPPHRPRRRSNLSQGAIVYGNTMTPTKLGRAGTVLVSRSVKLPSTAPISNTITLAAS